MCFKVVGRNRIDQGKVEKVWVVMGITLALQCCRGAAFYTVKPALNTHPNFFKKVTEVSGRVGSANVQIMILAPQFQTQLHFFHNENLQAWPH